MGRGSRFLESSATEEEDSYQYRVEWDDIVTIEHITDENGVYKGCEAIHDGPGSRDVAGFDNAWDVYNDCRDDTDYVHVRLIKLDSDGYEVSRWE